MLGLVGCVRVGGCHRVGGVVLGLVCLLVLVEAWSVVLGLVGCVGLGGVVIGLVGCEN